ncbi:MAG: molybdenum cofactor guanylyltransferase [Bacteroidetes bacterium]|nr:molybdenum cofactor guanylyltransferase [Bacteroidota bacterium]MBS1973204.1 molybdenum cofactor guanylyltransferase [Bacteroidota bacterium]
MNALNRFNTIEAFVLAGGKSSRMGQDKAMMLLDGKPMIAYVLDTINSFQLPIKIVANSEGYEKFDYDVVKDIVPDKGPMGGLYTALHYNTRPNVLLISCDTPFISAQAVDRLLNETKNNPVTVAGTMTRINPLFAVYHQSLRQKISTCIIKNNLKMKEFIFSENYKTVNMDDLAEQHQFLFFNINNKTDFEQCSNRLKQKI